MATEQTENPFVGMWTKDGQCVVVRRDQLHLPHIVAHWTDNVNGSCGTCAVLPGETDEQAARRAFGRLIPTRYSDTLAVYRQPLFSEPQRA